tara:strand:+ start:23152 stop:23496 length:345 start_codon:yes stop_codon:yes gene_type:complete
MKTFEQWLAELVMTGGEGKPQPPAAQKVATVNAKNVAAKALQSTPQIASKIAGGGAGAKQAKVKLAADVGADLTKTAGNDVDPTKAALSAVGQLQTDIEDTIDEPAMMKKRMKK